MELQVVDDQSQVDEEVASGDHLLPGLLPELAHFITDGVDSEGGEVEHQQQVGQTLGRVWISMVV